MNLQTETKAEQDIFTHCTYFITNSWLQFFKEAKYTDSKQNYYITLWKEFQYKKVIHLKKKKQQQQQLRHRWTTGTMKTTLQYTYNKSTPVIWKCWRQHRKSVIVLFHEHTMLKYTIQIITNGHTFHSFKMMSFCLDKYKHVNKLCAHQHEKKKRQNEHYDCLTSNIIQLILMVLYTATHVNVHLKTKNVHL